MDPTANTRIKSIQKSYCVWMDSTPTTTVNGGIDVRCHGFLNELALLVMAMSVVVGAIWEDSLVMIGLTAFGTVVKGWNEFKNFCTKMDMCRFAYTTYEKTLIELRTYVRGLPLEEFDGFLIKMQTMDDTITDLTPPTSDRIMKQYDRNFHHCPVRPKEHKLSVVTT